ncbi:MAG: hypothetical protein R3F13_14345 [Prosthecobacter sp.]
MKLYCLLLFTLCMQSQAQPLRHLFLDPAFLQQSGNVALHVNPPVKQEIVIRHDKPWEQLMISFYLSVMEDEGKLRMWYICRDKKNQPNVAYAESTDGVNWIKPNLGIVEYEGSKENNLVGLDSLEGTVYRDERMPASQRYNYITHLWTEGMVRFHSPDGLHWQRDAAPLLKFGADSQAVAFWDAPVKKYALYLRAWEQRPDLKLYRTVVRVDLPSLTDSLKIEPFEKARRLWGKDKNAVIDDEFPNVLETDDADPPDSDVYTISAQTYPLDTRWYLGFPSFFQRDKNRSDGRLEVQCIGSRDGVKWQRYDRAAYVAPGLRESESANMAFIGPGMIIRGDEIWQYGVGLASRHGDREARMRKTDGAIYRHVQRVDGFVSLDFEAKGGRCLTQPVKVEGPRLSVNLDTTAMGHMRVALTDAKGVSIPGYEAEEATILRTNSTHAKVTWKEHKDVSALLGREVCVEFSGARSKVYSFRFEPEDQP